MKGKRVEYHEGAVADVKSALVWYRERSPNAALDFIEELHRATNTIRESPDRWPSAQITPDGSCFGDSLFPLSTLSKNPQSQSGLSLMGADDRNIGQGG